MRFTRVFAVLACALGLLLVAATPAGAATWVGLGDSFAAGPLIPNQVAPYGCLKSDQNFARHASARLGYSLTDMSCSGAKTDHMTQSQDVEGADNPPQFNALGASTNVVTLQIGGNDIGFSGILESCATENPFDGCKDEYVHDGRDEISERINATAPKVAAVLAGHPRALPSARIFVVNYAAILPDLATAARRRRRWPLRRPVHARQAKGAERDAGDAGGGGRGHARGQTTRPSIGRAPARGPRPVGSSRSCLPRGRRRSIPT